MEYSIYKLKFLCGVHFGKNTLDSSGYTFFADTLFSGLFQEALKLENGDTVADTLVHYVRDGSLVFSDAFPYIEDNNFHEEYYLPKPMIHIENDADKGDSSKKKMYKKLAYIPVSCFDAYLNGNFPIERADELDRKFGWSAVKVSAAIRGEEETVPYRVGAYYFKEGSGLYLIAGFGTKEVQDCFELLLKCVSFSGIGGKRSAGFGRFELLKADVPKMLHKRLKAGETKTHVMTLSVSLPTEDELSIAIEGASYLLQKRSGFVASETFAKEQRRKKDLYVFQAGSCFRTVFHGDVYDVSSGGAHPVYRYAKPLFMEVAL